MESQARTFSNQVRREQGWVRWRILIGRRKSKLLFKPQLVELLQAMDPQEGRRRVDAMFILATLLHLVVQALQDFTQVARLNQLNRVRDRLDHPLEILSRRGFRR